MASFRWLAILVLATNASAAAQDCRRPHFDRLDYPASGPVSLTIGDYNADLLPDLAVASYWSGTIAILLNRGDGTFADDGHYFVGSEPYGIATGDLDNDADLDIVASRYGDHLVSVLLNHGDGTFADAAHYWVGFSPVFVAIGDLDGDSDLDLAVANATTDTVSVLLNEGDGAFAEHALYEVGWYPWSIAVDDLDGDSDLDLAVANFGYNFTSHISLLMNHGDGTFADEVRYNTGSGILSISSGDVDGDLDPDLVVVNPGTDELLVLLNDGRGMFYQAAPAYEVEDQPRSVALGDVDGDFDLDIAIGVTLTDVVSILLNDGNGAFAGPISVNAGVYPAWVALGDLDRDSDTDVAVANVWGDSVTVLSNTCIVRADTVLVDSRLLAGTRVSGGLDELRFSDDCSLEARSALDLTGFGPNVVDLLVGAETAAHAHGRLELMVESRITHPSGTLDLRLRNWSDHDFDLIASFAVGPIEELRIARDVPTAPYVRPADGRIEIRPRYVVVAAFSPLGFDAHVDLVRARGE